MENVLILYVGGESTIPEGLDADGADLRVTPGCRDRKVTKTNKPTTDRFHRWN